MTEKQYGLILPKDKKAPLFKTNKNVFGSDSDDSDSPAVSKKKPLLDTNERTKRQVKNMQEKAIAEDPTVFQYDELYDDLKNEKVEAKVAAKKDKAPKYIENLMVSATKRKREQERRMEKKIQKEREQEGEEFADKESFVTSSYKKKMEEMRQEEEKEEREAYLEDIGDVTKQKDLGGFYRHLYEQKLGSDKKEVKEKSPEKEVKEKSPEKKVDERKSPVNETLPEKPKNRTYRKRKEQDSDLSEGEVLSASEEINLDKLEKFKARQKKANMDADSDFSIDSDSEAGSQTPELPKDGEDVKLTKEKENLANKLNDNKEANTSVMDIKLPEKEKSRSPSPEKPKIDIWAKRTVGDKFEEALKRYYERKSARGGSLIL